MKPTNCLPSQPLKQRVVNALPLILAIGSLFTLLLIPTELNPPQRGLFLAFLFGASLGVAEIVSRYRDEPVFAVMTKYGALYWFMNGMLGVWAFLVVWRFPEKFSIGFDPRSSAFLTALLAGFGGAAVMRARFVTLKDSNGKEQTIGPDVVLRTLLEVVDLHVDRERAEQRWVFLLKNFSTVLLIFRGFGSDFRRTADAFLASLYSYQNLSPASRQQLADVANAYDQNKEMPDLIRLMSITFIMITVAGERNFERVLEFLKTSG